MPIHTRIKGGGSGEIADVSSEKALFVTLTNRDASDYTREEVEHIAILTAQFADSDGATDMSVDGSTNFVDFTVGAVSTGGDIRFINQVRITIEGARLDMDTNERRRFGDAAASPGLTNGLRLFSKQTRTVADLFVAPVKTIGDFDLYASTAGRGVLSVKDGIAAGEDVLIVTIDLPAPVGLYPGTDNNLTIRVQDDLTAIDSITANAYGYLVTD